VGDPDRLVSVVHRDNARPAAVAVRIGHVVLMDEIDIRGHPCVLYGQPFPPW
jgi:hypothetical protein